MEMILKDYKLYLYLFFIAFLIAVVEVIKEIKLSEKTEQVIKKMWGRVVFFKDKIKSYASSSSSSSNSG